MDITTNATTNITIITTSEAKDSKVELSRNVQVGDKLIQNTKFAYRLLKISYQQYVDKRFQP